MNLEPILQWLPTLTVRFALIAVVLGMALVLRSVLVWLISTFVTHFFAAERRVELSKSVRNILIAPVGYLLFALSVDLSARILEASTSAFFFVTHVTRTLVIIAVMVFLLRMIRLLTVSRGGLMRFTGLLVEEALIPFVRTGLELLIIAIVIVILIQEWGYDVSGLIAGLGIGGLAISLAAQDTLSNLFGFTALVGDRPFLVGEYIKTKDVEGTVEQVGLRSTRVRQLDQAVVTIPNSMLAGSSILNWSRLNKRRIDMTFGVGFDTNADQMEMLLQRIRGLLETWEAVEKDSVIVYLTNFGQNSFEVLVRCYLGIADWGQFTAEKERILLAMMRIVDDLDLQLALPRQSLLIEGVTGSINLSEEPLQRNGVSQSEETPR